MINIIIYTELDLEAIKEEQELQFSHIAIPEMLDGCYNIICDEATWNALDTYLNANDNKHETVGEWMRKDGKQKKDGKEENKYTKSKYIKYLRDVPTEWDEDGNPTKWGKAPEDKKVNKVFGWTDRDLIEIV